MDTSNLLDILTAAIEGNHWITWLVALVVVIVAYGILKALKGIVLRQLRKIAEKSKTDIDDQVVKTIRETRNKFLALVALYVGSTILTLPLQIQKIFQTIAILGLLYQFGVWLSSLANYIVRKQTSEMQANTIRKIIRGVIWVIILLLALDNLGIQINTLVASLGITGIVIGLATQQILGDLFSSFLINVDKPFEEGDYIMAGSFNGTVEKVGWLSTRVRALSGELLVFGNSNLQHSTIQNYQQMTQRRAAFSLGVVYETPYEKMAAIPGMIREIIESQGKEVTFDRAHFKSYGDFSLNFDVVYYVESKNYALFMDLQQAINLDIMKRFEDEGIVFAYPTQTVFLEKGETGDPPSIL